MKNPKKTGIIKENTKSKKNVTKKITLTDKGKLDTSKISCELISPIPPQKWIPPVNLRNNIDGSKKMGSSIPTQKWKKGTNDS